jgi:hypothetical protein
MIVIGIRNGVVEICVSITDEQMQTVLEMYPEHVFMERAGEEDIGWTYDGMNFSSPE